LEFSAEKIVLKWYPFFQARENDGWPPIDGTVEAVDGTEAELQGSILRNSILAKNFLR
jgi:hypothetical protein